MISKNLLSSQQFEVIKKLKNLPKHSYMAGGTALALQLGHRTSLEDITAMRMIAISKRGKRRDFIDTYYLLKKFNLGQIIKLTLKKYPSYQPMVILKGLIYFKDAEKEDISRKIEIFDKDFSWERAKKTIFEAVKKYQLGLLYRKTSNPV